MKKTTIFCGVAALVLGVAFLAGTTSCSNSAKDAAEAKDSVAVRGSIVYFDMDRVLEGYDMAKDRGAAVESKAASIEQEINRRGSKIEKDMKAFQEKVNKGLMTQSTAEIQYRQLQEKQAEFQQYAQKKQQEISEEAAVTQNQILDAISTFVKEYNETMGYTMIIATQGGIISIPIVTADETLDITDELIEGLNKAYVKEKDTKE